MVAGVVATPRLDLMNEELLKSHLHAMIFARHSLNGLHNSLGDIVDQDNLDTLTLNPEIVETLKLTEQQKTTILLTFKKVIEDSCFQNELTKRKPAWFDDEWIKRTIDNYQQDFYQSLKRWHLLYKNAIQQFREANMVIENQIYAENHEKIREARRQRRQAERQLELLLNKLSENGQTTGNNQSEFYPYRYLAAEGFLPGYNFTRRPIRAFLENSEGAGEFISRPRPIALTEFGPQNIIYHDGAKYRIERMILTEAETKMERAKISPFTGYIMMREQYHYNVDPLVNLELTQGMDRFIHADLVEMTECRAGQLQRITCQEEERTRKGYDTGTYFAVEGGFESIDEAHVILANEKLLHIHAIPAARLVQINFKWRISRENGFALNLRNGFWQRPPAKNGNERRDDIRRIKLFTTTTANALYIQPVAALALKGQHHGVITLMYALKRAIENYFQMESNEIGATIMGEVEAPNILIYEAAEGSLGVLSQIVNDPPVYQALMQEAFNLCFMKDGREVPPEELLPATYDDLLSYYNQMHHQVINRNYIRDSLQMLKDAQIVVQTSKSFDSYDAHYQALQAARDPDSSTEDQFLKYLYTNGLKLPDEAQPKIANLYVRPDFLYKPNVCIFCDGTPHDDPQIRDDDKMKRNTLTDAGYQVIAWYYREPLDEFIRKRPDIFKLVKGQ